MSESATIGNDPDLQSLHILDLYCKDRLKYIFCFSIEKYPTRSDFYIYHSLSIE